MLATVVTVPELAFQAVARGRNYQGCGADRRPGDKDGRGQHRKAELGPLLQQYVLPEGEQPANGHHPACEVMFFVLTAVSFLRAGTLRQLS